MNALIWSCVMVPVCGIIPASICARMLDFFAFTSAKVVSGPPELTLPLAWQLLLIEQSVVSIGCTSVENFGAIPLQVNVLAPPPVPPPPPSAEVLLYLQDTNAPIPVIITVD